MDESRITCVLVEEHAQLTLMELSRACDVQAEAVAELVAHGVIEPLGDTRHAWRFGGDSLRRTRIALRLIRDLGVNPAGAAQLHQRQLGVLLDQDARDARFVHLTPPSLRAG